MNGGMGGFFGFGFLGILIILAIIFVIFWMMKPGSEKNSHYCSNHQSVETLKERLAKGDISEEEYDRLKRKLEE